MEIVQDFRSLAEFRAFLDANAALLNEAVFDGLGREVLDQGCTEPLSHHRIGPEELTNGGSWREGLARNGICSRVRGVMRSIEEVVAEDGLQSPRIYAAEGVTPFALLMRSLFPRFLGSEYTTNSERKKWMYPIPCEDLQNLSLPSNSFDIVSTNEVLEHVPSVHQALSEMCRVLKPGGWHIGTVPFLYFNERAEIRAVLDSNGKVIHLLEAQYHGDPMNEGGALVFELPGWDIIERARNAGFRDAFIRLMISSEYGVLSEHIGGVLLLMCQK